MCYHRIRFCLFSSQWNMSEFCETPIICIDQLFTVTRPGSHSICWRSYYVGRASAPKLKNNIGCSLFYSAHRVLWVWAMHNCITCRRYLCKYEWNPFSSICNIGVLIKVIFFCALVTWSLHMTIRLAPGLQAWWCRWSCRLLLKGCWNTVQIAKLDNNSMRVYNR